ncbi:MAG: lipopolysaccharide heptosyltransferase II, partial [Nitrospira sp.]|nr:lipopolysaccharide heptosyltransferase II [Nitrospira sp.]
MSLWNPQSLIVRIPNWIGDAVMCEPALRDLRDQVPLAHLAILARPAIGQLFQGHPAIDEIVEYDWRGIHRGMLGLGALMRGLRSKKFEMAVLFQNAFEAAFIAWGAGISTRVGYPTDGRRAFLTQAISLRGSEFRHQTEYYRKIVAEAFSCQLGNRLPSLVIRPEEEIQAATKFPDVFDDSAGMLVGINPGSVYGSAKRWLPERFAEVVNKLVRDLKDLDPENREPRCVIVGGMGEESLGRTIAARLSCETSLLSGRTTIREMLSVLKRCAIFLTNDTGPMHVAQALGVPVVAIFGSTDPDSTGPVDQAHGVVRSSVRCAPCFLRTCPIDHRCMTGVTVEQVVDAARAQLAHRSVVSK